MIQRFLRLTVIRYVSLRTVDRERYRKKETLNRGATFVQFATEIKPPSLLFFFFLPIVTVATLNYRDANANEETLHVFSNRKNTFKGSGGRAWFTIIENKDLPVILCLKKVEVLLDTIAQLADREFILLAGLRWTLKHQIKRIRLASRSIRNVFYSSKRTACRSLYIKIVPKDKRTNFHARTLYLTTWPRKNAKHV